MARKKKTTDLPVVIEPEFIVTTETLIKARELGGLGMRVEHIGYYFGMDHSQWYATCKRCPQLAKAVKIGRSHNISFACGKLFESVQRGNLSAIIFYLKTQAHFSEVMHFNDDAEPASVKAAPNVLAAAGKDPIEAARIYQKIMIGT